MALQKKVIAVAGLAIAVCAVAIAGARLTAAQQAGVVMSSNAGGQAQAGQSAQASTGDAALPKFEVASIKKHVDDNSGNMVIRLGGPDVGRYTPTNVSLKLLIEFAYNMKDFQVSGGPGWINSDRFDVNAKVEDATVEELKKLPREQQQDQMRVMVRALLAERFKLKLSHQTKEMPVYALVQVKGGTKLKESPPPDPQSATDTPQMGSRVTMGKDGRPILPRGTWSLSMRNGSEMTMTGNAIPISSLTDLLGRQLGREVVDQTGLKGVYDVTLQYTQDATTGGGGMMLNGTAPQSAEAGGTSVFTALQEQLGLKLDSTKGPVETLVIESAEQPSEN